MNALTYREIFKLIKENKIQTGYGFNLSVVFKSMYKNVSKSNKDFCKQKGYDGEHFITTPAINWYTNLTVKKHHEKLTLYKNYSSKEYPKYENFDAINVDKVTDIPCDYNGLMGVPITFVDKCNPEQFEIIGLGISNSGIEIGVKPYKPEHKKYRKEVQGRGAVDGDLYMMKDGIVDVPYARIIIKNKEVI
jgi:hypothetical protein